SAEPLPVQKPLVDQHLPLVAVQLLARAQALENHTQALARGEGDPQAVDGMAAGRLGPALEPGDPHRPAELSAQALLQHLPGGRALALDVRPPLPPPRRGHAGTSSALCSLSRRRPSPWMR